MQRHIAISGILALVAGCGLGRGRFIVRPAVPHYILEAPDGRTRAFPETMAGIGDPYAGWADLKPGMTLKLDRAFFDPPESRKLSDYLGLEVARFRFDPGGGLRQIEYSPLSMRRTTQPPVTDEISAAQRSARFHRLLFQVVVDRKAGSSRAILVSGSSQPEVAALSEDLIRGQGCAQTAKSRLQCAEFEASTSASVTFDILANGKSLPVSWGSTVASIVAANRPVSLLRAYRGRRIPVLIDAADPNALRLPLLPGDDLRFGPGPLSR